MDIYRAAIDYVGWAYRFCGGLAGHRNAKDHLLRASQAIPLNIAEGKSKGTETDRRRYFEIARRSALECGTVQDVLQLCGAMTADQSAKAKALLDRIVAMLTKLGQRGYSVNEEKGAHQTGRTHPDTNTDPDADGNERRRECQPEGPGDSQGFVPDPQRSPRSA